MNQKKKKNIKVKKPFPTSSENGNSVKKPLTEKFLAVKKTSISWAKKIILWGISAGFATVIISWTIDYFGREIRLEYSKSLSSGYEFVLKNDGPSDQEVQSFRMKAPNKQSVVYETDRDIVAPYKDGKILLPKTWIPAYEYRGADGLKLAAKTEKKFRLPPLASEVWALPSAVLVEFEIKTNSQNSLLHSIEWTLERLNIQTNVTAVSFMVIRNYWTPVATGKFKDAIGEACRENILLAGDPLCTNRK